MLSNVRLKLSAVEDLAEGYAWYEQRRAGLGDEFLTAIRQRLTSIERHPRTSAIVYKNVRQALVKRFPYSIFYECADKEIVVRAIFHSARRPSSWRKRIREDKPELVTAPITTMEQQARAGRRLEEP
jgi:plasmid stabilization system protein ParE